VRTFMSVWLGLMAALFVVNVLVWSLVFRNLRKIDHNLKRTAELRRQSHERQMRGARAIAEYHIARTAWPDASRPDTRSVTAAGRGIGERDR
jgi:hypothetical protein